MAVRFILGRAGAGKSSYCVESLRAELVRQPYGGSKLILLVPEQASLQAERELINTPELAGAQRGEVLSFKRFAQRLLQANPAQSHKILSPVGRTMVLQRLVGEHRPNLQYFRTDRLLPGLYKQLSLQIEEFMAAAVEPDELASDDDADVSAETLTAKLADLRVLYSAYLRFLRGGYVDPAMTLEQARKTLPTARWIQGAHIWVDGFASFSVQESEFLIELATHAEGMEITLLVDPQADGIANERAPDPYSLFWPTMQTYGKLLEALARRGVQIDHPLCLPQAQHNRPTRSVGPVDLTHLEANLFGASPAHDKPPTNIKLSHAADLDDEMNYVVRQITELTSRQVKPLRYRDIAVVTRQLGQQDNLIAGALKQNNIPYFVDRRPPLSEHPLYYHLRALLTVAAEQLSTESVRQLLKSDLLGLTPADADQLEHYIIAYRIMGPKTWTGPDWQRDPAFRSPFDDIDERGDTAARLKSINVSRRALLERLAPWIPTDGGKPRTRQTGRKWAKLLYETIEHGDVPEQIERWAVDADGDGLAAEAAHHRQAWRAVVQLFDDFLIALGDSELTLTEFVNSFEAGLSQLDTGLVPPAVDQVLVGSIERSRHPAIRAAFVVGFNDGAYPLTHSEELLLNDDDRRRLVDAGLGIDPPRVERLAQERLLTYIALTRPKEHLFISYSRADPAGHPLEESPYLAELRRIFPRLAAPQHAAGDLETRLQKIVNADDLVAALALNLSEADHHSTWGALYDRARNRDELRAVLGRALQSLTHSNDADLSTQLVAALHRTSLRTSITNLERYAACPFQYFASVQLKLQPRPTGEMDALQLGALYHAVLDRFTRQLISDKVQLGALTDDQVEQRLVEHIQHFNSSFAQDAASEGIAQPFLWERLHHELLEALHAHRTIQAAGTTATLASELAFGLGQEGSLPALELSTPKGRRVLLRGKIDRVDLADRQECSMGFVFDYKRSRRRLLSLSDVYHGLSQQLMVYLLALETLGKKLTGQPVTPGGAFYLALIPNFETVKHPNESSDRPLKHFRPRGLFREDALHLLEREPTDGWSEVLAVRRNKDGSISKVPSSEAVDADDFRRLMQHVRRTVGDICDDILDGKIPVKPYRSKREMPCKYCDYRAVCRFQFSDLSFRNLEALDKKEVWKRLKNNG